MSQKAVMRYQSVYPSLSMLGFLRSSGGPVIVCVCETPVGEPVGDFAPGWDRATGRPVFMCVYTIEKAKECE